MCPPNGKCICCVDAAACKVVGGKQIRSVFLCRKVWADLFQPLNFEYWF